MAFINSELWKDVAIHQCFQNALDDLDSLKQAFGMKDAWRLMGIFYLCGRKWGKGAQCEAALSSLVPNIYPLSLELQFVCLTLLELEASVEDLNSVYSFFVAKKRAILGEMDELHQILSNESLERSSASHIDMEDLLFIIDYLHLSNLRPDLRKSIRLLKDFIGFVRLRGLEPQQMGDLLIHVRGVLVDAACFLFRKLKGLYNDYDDDYKLIDRIEPLETQVCEIYVGVLQKALGLPEPSSNTILAPGSQTPLLADFIDSLLFLIRQLLFRHTYSRVYHHLMYKLYQGLRSLRTTTVAEEHGKIGVLICDAGITVCYLFHVEKEAGLGEKLEHHFLSFEEIFKLLKPEEEVPRYQLPLECPQTNLLGFIDSLLVNINGAGHFFSESTMNKLNTIHDDLAYLRSFWVTVMGQQHQNGKLQVLWSHVAAVAYETEFVLDSLLVGDTHQSLIVLLDAISSDIERIKTEAWRISNNMGQFIEFQRTTENDSKKHLAAKIPKSDEHIVGLDDESQNIIERLTRGTKMLDLVSIVGMAGLGKTTLALKVPSITFHFLVQAWCTVSQGRDKKSLLLEILHSLGKSVDEKKSEDDLGDELRRYLKGKRYLVILDDVWDIEVWSGLRISFPCDGKGSRILVTTRSKKVASLIKSDVQPYCLRFLTNDESWELFHTKLGFEEDCPPELVARGELISACCKGLPLMIVVVAGILSNMEPCKWEEIEKSMKNGNLPTMQECEEIVELSYHHLPDYLKPCFLYFGAYKEDQKVSVRELLWLWIAEGFVKKTEKEHELEGVAKGYMMELIQRNLIMVAKRGSRGLVKSCVLHDVLLDFCKRKGKQEHFLHSLHGYELRNLTPPPPRMLYRLHVKHTSGVEDFAESMQLFPHLRTLLFHDDCEIRSQGPQWYDILYNFCQSRLLRILDMHSVFRFTFFPNVIPQHLGHLRYLTLAVRKPSVKIPSSIALVLNLETFIIVGGIDEIWLPDVIWNMKKLRHLKAFGWWEFVWGLATENPNNLENLQTLSGVVIHDDQAMKEVTRKFPNVRRLKCWLKFVRDQDGALKIFALDFLSQLESLSIHGVANCVYQYQFEFPHNLKKLTLAILKLPWSEIAAIDRLPNLEVLKLLFMSFSGEAWHIGGEGTTFPKLKFLHLGSLDLVRWTMDSEDSFPCLEKLVLDRCYKLAELPICFLAQSSTLQLIEVYLCDNITNSIKDLEEMKTELGNEDMKIFVKELNMERSE